MKPEKQSACRTRRRFLLSIGLGAVGGAAFEGRAVARAVAPAAAVPRRRGYRITEHIGKYYRTTKV